MYAFIKETLGGTNASGLRVLSEEYSKPGSIILTLPILLIFLDIVNISAFIPCVDAILTNCGNWLYPNPPKYISTNQEYVVLPTLPFVLFVII